MKLASKYIGLSSKDMKDKTNPQLCFIISHYVTLYVSSALQLCHSRPASVADMFFLLIGVILVLSMINTVILTLRIWFLHAACSRILLRQNRIQQNGHNPGAED